MEVHFDVAVVRLDDLISHFTKNIAMWNPIVFEQKASPCCFVLSVEKGLVAVDSRLLLPVVARSHCR
jgi:hypothetical protein